jgi:hypothetical protein
MSKTGICSIPEKEAAVWLLWAINGHYMGLNLGVFLQIGEYTGTDFWIGQSDGFTGVFSCCHRI